MADKKPTTHRAGTATGQITKLPTVAIPVELRAMRCGYPGFSINTPRGPISVEARGGALYCRGPVEAILAHGLISPEWLPGLPGNGITSQRVVFEEDGPRLVQGNPYGKRPPKSKRIIIRAWGFVRRTVLVEIPMSPEQIEQVNAVMEEWERQQQACEATKDRSAQESPISANDWAQRNVGLVNRLLDQVRGHATVEYGGHAFSTESQHRILLRLVELREAFSEGCVVSLVPKYQRIDNVICWPGRGRVMPVTPPQLLQ